MIDRNSSDYNTVLKIPRDFHVKSFLPAENVFFSGALFFSDKVDDTYVISDWLAKVIKSEGVNLDHTMRKNSLVEILTAFMSSFLVNKSTSVILLCACSKVYFTGNLNYFHWTE